MTALSVKEKDYVLANSFALEFLNAKLTQKRTSIPTIYQGSASITQDLNGRIQLKLYHIYQNPSHLIQEISTAFGDDGLEVGKLIEDSHYYDFEGFDLFGKRWTAPHIWLKGDISLASNGRVVTAELSRIESEKTISATTTAPIQPTNPSAQFFIRGNFSIPFNEAEQVGNSIGITTCILRLPSSTCTLRKHETHLEIIIQSVTNELSDEYLNLILEGISIAIGSNLKPQLKSAKSIDSRQVIIYSTNTKGDAAQLPPPIPTTHPHHAEFLENFVSLFVEKVTGTHSHLVGYWYRILNAFSNDPENSALVLTTCIEGLIKTHFMARGQADKDLLEQIEEAGPLLKEMTIGERVKNLLTTSLGNAKSPRPKSALLSLEESGLITEDLTPLWNKLRNKSAHADELKMETHDLQKFIDELHGCLELFYRLVVHHIGYEGNIIQYAKPGWPECDLSRTP
jgi:hypothetical protein